MMNSFELSYSTRSWSLLRESLHYETIQKIQAARGQLGDCPNVSCNPLQLDDLGSISCIIRI